jgi:hypothetical protein
MAYQDSASTPSSQQSVAQTPQQSHSPSVQTMSAESKAQAVEAARPSVALMDKATQHRAEAHSSDSSQGGSREALMHNQSAAGKSQEAMSPTDSGKGHKATQQRAQTRSRGMER